MIKDLRHTFRQTAIYGIGNVLVKATGVLLLPIYLNALSADDMGVLVTMEIITQFFVGVMAFNIPTAMLRFGSEEGDQKKQARIYSTALLMLLGAVSLFLLVFMPLRGVANSIMFSNDRTALFTVLITSIALEILSVLPLQLLRLKEKGNIYILFLAVKLAGILGFVWYFLAIEQLGVYGALLGILMGNLCLLLVSIPLQIKYITRAFDKDLAYQMYRFGAPLIFTTISGVLLTIADRAIIKIFGEYADVGIYGVAYKIGSIANLLIIGSFSLGFLPIAFKKFKDPGFQRFFSKIHTYFIGLTALLTLGISVFGKEVIKILSPDSPEYWVAVILVPFIAYVFIFKAIQNYLSFVFLLTKQTKYHAMVTVIGVILNIALNFVLIPAFGLYGAIAATGVSYIAMAIITFHFAQKHFKVDYELGRLGLLLLSCAVFIALGVAVNDLEILPRLALKVMVIASFPVFLYFVVADQTEQLKLKKVIALARQKGGWKKILKELEIR